MFTLIESANPCTLDQSSPMVVDAIGPCQAGIHDERMDVKSDQHRDGLDFAALNQHFFRLSFLTGRWEGETEK